MAAIAAFTASVLANNSEEAVFEGLTLLGKLIENKIKSPEEAKFNSFKRTNPKVVQKILSLQGGINDLIVALGFTVTSDDRYEFNGEMRTLMFNYGFVKFYQRKEHHEWNAPMTKMLHAALKDGRPDKKTGLTLQEGTPSAAQLDLYDTYKTTQDATPATTIRDMLEIEIGRASCRERV